MKPFGNQVCGFFAFVGGYFQEIENDTYICKVALR